MNEAKLKACPFCGKPATVRQREHRGKNYWAIGCANAACRGVSQIFGPDKDQEVADWNTRAGDREPEAAQSEAAAADSLQRVVSRTDSELLDALQNLPYALDITYKRGQPKADSVPTLRQQISRFLEQEESAANDQAHPQPVAAVVERKERNRNEN